MKRTLGALAMVMALVFTLALATVQTVAADDAAATAQTASGDNAPATEPAISGDNAAATQASRSGRIQTTGSFVWVRSGPGTQYRSLGKLTAGSKVTILASVAGQAVDRGQPLWYKIGDGRYVYSGLVTLDGEATGEKWIEVILSQQKLIAWEGSRAVLTSIVSTGKPATPTVKGTYRIYLKYEFKDMRGPGYFLPKVPHTMFFYQGYAIHGTYWHTNFGRVMSRGCVNVNLKDAGWLYDWAPMATKVVIHD